MRGDEAGRLEVVRGTNAKLERQCASLRATYLMQKQTIEDKDIEITWLKNLVTSLTEE